MPGLPDSHQARGHRRAQQPLLSEVSEVDFQLPIFHLPIGNSKIRDVSLRNFNYVRLLHRG